MFGKTEDKITALEGRADEGLGTMDSFICELESAQEDASDLNDESQIEIDRLEAVQKKCARVGKFTTALLKLAK